MVNEGRGFIEDEGGKRESAEGLISSHGLLLMFTDIDIE